MDIYAAMREALGLLRRGQYEDAVHRCAAGLELRPDYVPLRLVLCEALIGLHRDGDAEAHLRYCLDLDPHCGPAYRQLAELELRRDQPKAAARLLNEACRLSPGDREARDLLTVVERRLRPEAERPVYIPSPRRPSREVPAERGGARDAGGQTVTERTRRRQHFARGTDSPANYQATPLRDEFGEYLTELGLLSRAQVRAALIYRRTRGVDLGHAALALGFLSEPNLRWAEQAYRASRAPRES